uniref:RHS repeat-associated core domain-containing protein n=2 Tax=unclassified Prevotella TaxID=2638335 RepID=A0AB33JFT0_9BACT
MRNYLQYNGKELDRMHGLDWYDYGARHYDAVLGRWMCMDPLAEKYYDVSSYGYCKGNPIIFIDSDGKIVKPFGYDELSIILCTLSTEDAQYVAIDRNGYININLINSHKSASPNFGYLQRLVNSDLIYNIALTEKDVEYANNDGGTGRLPMTYDKYPDWADKNGDVTINATENGEIGRMGVTLLPGKGTSGVNSKDSNVWVYINSKLSRRSRVDAYSHEANGHGVIYEETRDRSQSGHQFGPGNKDENEKLKIRILNSKKESRKHMDERRIKNDE